MGDNGGNGSDNEDDDSETKSHKHHKQEFEKREKDYNRKISNLQKEKLIIESALKNLEIDISNKKSVTKSANPLYQYLDDANRRRAE